MKNTNYLLTFMVILLSCTGNDNNPVPKELEKQALDIATDFAMKKLINGTAVINKDGKFSVGDSTNCYIINPAGVFAGRIDNNASVDLLITVDTFQVPYLVPMYHLILNKENDNFVIKHVIKSDARILGLKRRIITAEVPTHTPDSPLYFCSECTDTVEYKLIDGKLVGDEPIRIGD